MTHTHSPDGPADCFGCKVKTIQIGEVAGSEAMTKRDAVLSKDLDAYKRLRNNGVQPSRIDGCAALEAKANSAVEVERHTLMSSPIRKELERRMTEVGS